VPRTKSAPSENGFDGRRLLAALRTVKNGDFTARLPADQAGMAGAIAEAFNDVAELMATSTREMDRISHAVGKEGKIKQRASLPGAAGGWAVRVESINSLIADLVQPTEEVARVIGAVAKGDLSQRISLENEGIPLKGEFLRIGKTVNRMVDQLGSFTAEVIRVAREVGTEGKLGGQAQVQEVAGTWKDLTDSVNNMAGNLTAQVRNIADVTTAVANGDLSKKITVDVRGEILELKNTINTMVDQLGSFASEVTRVAREVGTDGRLGGQAEVRGVAGTWKDLTDSVNFMAGNLTAQVRNIAEVTTAVANGDLTKKVTVDVRGEILELKNTINTMVDQLNSFASEVTRVAREVGTDGKLGGQALVRGVAGVWKDLTDNVNSMASNLTAQVRGIAKVVTAVANGDLKRKLVVEAKGEIAALSDTINEMIDTLATFAEQVTTVAREVGVEGKLGGQAKVPGAAGTWKGLTENVNQLAANLTTQVRAIAEVATAVTKGDLTRSIAVEALGEVASLKDNINEMIRNLKDTTQKNNEQDWLKTNLAKFTRMLQGERDLMTVTKLILSELAPVVSAQHGVFYLMQDGDGSADLRLTSTYAYRERKGLNNRFRVGEGLVGQCAFEKQRILLTEVPGDYIHVSSGLGEAPPLNIVVLPVLFEGNVKAVIELGSFNRFKEIHLTLLDQLTETIAIVLNTIEANMRTEGLLKKSQTLADELQGQQEELREKNSRLERQAASLQASEELLKKQQEELQGANEELQQKARQLTSQKAEVEGKNREIELAKLAIQERAEQLAVTSKYKSEFLANMSHELRTPLNSLLILAEMLGDNVEGNLSGKQQEFARTIYDSGSDLLALINDILDMAKIESGTMALEVRAVSFREFRDYVDRTFRPVAQSKDLQFTVDLAPGLPRAISTDAKRLQQVLRNLLSNAFKFTEAGKVALNIEVATSGWSTDHPVLTRADTVLAFSVSDTGTGIPLEKLRVIFEPFQQADMGTSRRYGGTGLGLSISRDIAYLLGGEIRVQSASGDGSVFTLYLPQKYLPTAPRPHSVDEPEAAQAEPAGRAAGSGPPHQPEYGGDRDTVQSGDPILLVIEHDPKFAAVLLEMAHEKDLKALIVSRGENVLALAKQFRPIAVTLDLQLPDMNGWVVLERLKGDPQTRQIPVHVISVDETVQRGLRRGAVSCLRKPVSRKDLEEAFAAMESLAGNRNPLPAAEGNDIERANITGPALAGKKALIVDDDVRNLFALTSMLERWGVRVIRAETGREALDRLENNPDIDVVLMDIMMPEMNGYETIRQIRRLGPFHALPIIALTAKAMKGDRQKCLDAGATDYIAKPVQGEHLLAMLRVWLSREEAPV
jgi:signal transduction histidine kinase/DNA-binding response OmpR family regulator/HAMP domain-containing protein